MTDTELKMRELIDKLNAASDTYYSGGDEIMSDHEWDALFDELLQLEQSTGIILPDSPVHRVSHESMTGKKEKHEFPALSLPKSKNPDDVVKWAGDKPVDLSWKLDGLTLVVTYDNGKLNKIVTRGNGEIGSNITHLAKAIRNIPDTISYTGHLVIRGEAVISYEDFKRVNMNGDRVYENPRNLAAGSCNPASDVESIMDRGLTWIPFTLVHMDTPCVSWSDRMEFLRSLGFETVAYESITDPSDISSVIKSWSDAISSINYPVDGLVVVYDDTDYASQGTVTGHHDTRGGFAFKWTDETAGTVLDHIEWSVSMNSINPVAVFDTVRLEGTNVSRASLCNIDECRRLGIGGKGTKLTVIKANKIIPKVIAAVPAGEFEIPSVCPVCGGKTRIDVSDTWVQTLVCDNPDCPAKYLSRLTRFVSLRGFDIKGLSEKRLAFLIDKGLIHDGYDILTLPDKADVSDLLSYEDGWGEKSVENLFDSIRTSFTVTIDRLLYALCIPMIGTDAAKKIAKLGSVDKIVGKAMQGDQSYFASTIGDVKSGEFVKWFSIGCNAALVRNLLVICHVKSEESGSGKLTGMTFVITGKLSHYSSRDVLKAEIEKEGGHVAGSVSANTSYLINNDAMSTSGKNKKAKELGISIISEDDIISMLKGA